jgi:hypothetical protein
VGGSLHDAGRSGNGGAAVAGGGGEPMAEGGSAGTGGEPPVVVTEGVLLKPENPSLDDRFGDSIALSGSTLAVGNATTGAVYIYERTDQGWISTATIDPMAFGSTEALTGSVALSGDTLLASAASVVHVFVRSADRWQHQAELAVSDARRLALDDDVALVGWNYGARTFIRTDGQWSELGPFETASGKSIEGAVALSGKTAALAGVDVTKPELLRVVTMYVRSGQSWSEQATLAPGDSDGIHISKLALTGDTLLVNNGAVHRYTRSGTAWSEQPMPAVTDASQTDETSDLAASAARFAVRGVRGASEVVLLFELTGSNWQHRTTLDLTYAGTAKERLAFSSTLTVSNQAVAISGRYVLYAEPEQNHGVVYAF